MMPTWLIVALAVLWVSVPIIGLWLAVRQVRREIAAEDAADAAWSETTIPDTPVLTMQRANPRGVGRHDWPL